MTLKIISMDKFKADAADRKLQEMFAVAPLPDNGFSEKIERRVRRDARRRLFVLSIAMVAGLLFAAGPLLQLLQQLGLFAVTVTHSAATVSAPLAVTPIGVAISWVAALLMAAGAAVRLLED